MQAVEGFYADRVVFSVKGISAEGFLTDPDALEAEVKRAMISRAATVVLWRPSASSTAAGST